MSEPAPVLPRRFTWLDYQTWPADERWELLGGEAYAMSPSPGIRHQELVLRLGAQLLQFFKGSRCQPYIAPLDVKEMEIITVRESLAKYGEPGA